MNKTKQTTAVSEVVESVTDENGLVVNTNTGEITPFDASTLKLKRRVTLPVLKQRVGAVIHIIFVGAMEIGKVIKTDDKKKDPATIAKVYDVAHKRFAQIICNTVTKSTLLEEYPDHGYVGRGFSIELFTVEGKDYKAVELSEFEIPEDLKYAIGKEISSISGAGKPVEEKEVGYDGRASTVF